MSTGNKTRTKTKACPFWKRDVIIKWTGSFLVFVLLLSSMAASKFCVIALCRMVSVQHAACVDTYTHTYTCTYARVRIIPI
jgi:hypothetical protein